MEAIYLKTHVCVFKLNIKYNNKNPKAMINKATAALAILFLRFNLFRVSASGG
jgi:hypothetical protein